MPLSFWGAGNLSGGTPSDVVPIEWQLMPVCAAKGCVWIIARQTAITARPAIFREDRAAWDANRAKICSCRHHKPEPDQVRAAIGPQQHTLRKMSPTVWVWPLMLPQPQPRRAKI